MYCRDVATRAGRGWHLGLTFEFSDKILENFMRNEFRISLQKKLLVSRNFVFRETGCSIRKPVSNGSYFEKQNWNLILNLKNTFWVNLAKLLYVTDYFALHVIFVCNYNFCIAIICYSDSSFLFVKYFFHSNGVYIFKVCLSSIKKLNIFNYPKSSSSLMSSYQHRASQTIPYPVNLFPVVSALKVSVCASKKVQKNHKTMWGPIIG